ncbi:bestrophin family protein [Roseateles terrae]|uniref:Membrane protein n=1 Tax=Roseateles terrae TaxID=431060 RepID=A0ABR6GQL4_9BURK|nr:bestrophin family protein [Roseateles terrae]MBB3193996.1 putative membrane protein [Roseateles terrae]OWQ87871.1 bestrophin [Roseateles terrae]
MIVRDRPSGLHLFFIMKGSILRSIRWTLLANILLAVLVTVSHGSFFDHKLQVTALPFSLMGLPLAIFLGFRNNACYDRYWEARKMWGDVLQRCRSLARQLVTLVEPESSTSSGHATAHLRRILDDRNWMVRQLPAFAHALRRHLRGLTRPDPAWDHWMPEADREALARVGNPPSFLLLRLAQQLQVCRRQGRLDTVLATSIEAQLAGLTASAAACERIQSSPLPFAYTLLLHRTAYLYCFLLPFGLVDTMGWLTPLVVAIVAYTFFGLDAVGDEIEEPFGDGPNDLPMDAICRAIEIDMLQALGEPEVPPPLKPVDYLLT